MKKTVLAFTYAIFFIASQSHAWTKTLDFENGSVGAQAFSIYTNTSYSKDYFHSGSQASKIFYPAGGEGETSGGNYRYPPGISNGSEVWFRAYFYFPSDFDFRASPVSKLMRSKNGAGHMGITWYSDGTVGAANELDMSAFVRTNPNWENVFKLSKGKWQAVEMYFKFSPAAGSGIFRVWHDGKLVLEDTKTPTIASGYQVPGSFYGAYWNGGAPKNQSMYVDDVVWTSDTPANRDAQGNAYIGLGKGNSSSTPVLADSPPVAPNLR